MQLSELVRRIRRGEKDAVKELVAAYGSAVYQRAFERTADKELAREAARQTFGQFVAIVQQQPEDDGWNLWFGDLIEKNISTYAQISTDMRTIEKELDQEIVEVAYRTPSASVKLPVGEEPDQSYWRTPEPESEPLRRAGQEPPVRRAEQDETPPRSPEKSKATKQERKQDARARKQEVRVHKDSIREEIFDDQYKKKASRKGGHGVSIVLLILVSLLLLWVVAGVAMTLQWIPVYDLGYSWFNQTVFKLF
jgi:hypothetical protein